MVAEKFISEDVKRSPMFTIENNVIVGNPSAKRENNPIAKVILDSLRSYPDTVAQINTATGEKITFGKLRDLSVRCAIWLKKQGIGQNDIVCTSTPNQSYDCIPCLATLYLGAVVNPWFSELSFASARHFFDIIQPKILFACEESIEILAQVANDVGVTCKFVVFGRYPGFQSLEDIMAEISPEEIDGFRHVEPEDPKTKLGIILFSSGTTGTQKGTMLSYDALANHHMEQLLPHEGSNALWYSTMSWITGTCFITSCIRLRCTRILHSHFDPEETSQVVEKYKVNWAFLSPSALTQLYKNKLIDQYNYASLEVLATGGSKPSKVVLDYCRRALPHTLVTNTFGMTELGGMVVYQRSAFKKIDSIGYVVGGIKMKIIDSAMGNKLGPNQQGELCFKFDGIMLGYFKNPRETKKMLDDEGWLHTGDLGYFDEDGEISITDRIKEVIICQNYHISPSQIEGILLQHPEVKEVAVVPVPHQVDIERPMAFVVKIPGAKVTAEVLMELPASYDEYFRLTGGVVFLEKLPYTNTGKKSLRDLKEMAKAYAQ
ncbi:4-coumarate--CoA ligase 1-like [Copidosoma floridanum]|uniref:4-coumarate--CoA ligase 1-like n=1 Tax=Copidosoma floridanum TaxID=29053 RepID=UPI0006C99C95|nr:4-coumarate--CoA ligase 1-like [Copidosoma floridanum]